MTSPIEEFIPVKDQIRCVTKDGKMAYMHIDDFWRYLGLSFTGGNKSAAEELVRMMKEADKDKDD